MKNFTQNVTKREKITVEVVLFFLFYFQTQVALLIREMFNKNKKFI